MNRFLHSHYYIILLTALLSDNIPAKAWYIGKEEFAEATLNNGVLSHYNYAAGYNDVNLITTEIEPNNNQRPRISLEITNRNCRERKSYPAYHYSDTGLKTTYQIDRPVWGILWGYRDTNNYHALFLRTGESDPQGYDPPTLQYCILTITEGDTLLHTPWRNTPDNYLNPEEDYNRLLISPINGGFEIFIGREHEYRLGVCPDDRLFGNQAGIYIGSGANVFMRNWNVVAQKYIERTPYRTEEEISTHLSGKTHPYEGYYEIVAATSTSTNVRLGGEYQVALIYNNQEYKLLYLNGAQRVAEQWKPGMVKAILRPIDNGSFFHVTWFDVNHNPLSEEIKAICTTEYLKIFFAQSGTTLNFIKISPNTLKEKEEKKSNKHIFLL